MAHPWIYTAYKNGHSQFIQVGGPAIESKADLEWLKRALTILDDFAEPDPQPELAAAMECYCAPVSSQ